MQSGYGGGGGFAGGGGGFGGGGGGGFAGGGGGFGGGGGGGFQDDGLGGSQGGGKGGKRNDNQSLLPCTIYQIQTATQLPGEESWRVNGREASQVTVVGMVTSVDAKSTAITYRVDDGTGFIDVKVWPDNDESDAVANKRDQLKCGRTQSEPRARDPRPPAARSPPRRAPLSARARAGRACTCARSACCARLRAARASPRL